MNGGEASLVTQEKDPCFSENALSMKCLQTNDYDYSKCQKYFANYKECKTFWMNVRLQRKRLGINPSLPPLVDRIAMKKIFADTGKVPSTPDG
jgi:cytochrome c oxidase assembly protein subunit 23